VRPVQSLLALARQIRSDAQLTQLFATRPAREVWETLRREPRFAAFNADLLRHFADYGDRTFAELKLETPVADETPELVIELLQNYASARADLGTANTVDSYSRSLDRRQAADAAIATALARRPLRRAIFSLVLERTRRMVAHREDLRLMRSRAFGMVKRIIGALGGRFARTGLIDEPRDIFYLAIEEVIGAVRGTSVTRNLRSLVAQRRAEYELFKQQPSQSRIISRGIVLASMARPAVAVSPSAGELRELQGIGCSAGRVRGRARVVRSPEQHLNIRGEILVAPMTDPGWVFLMVPAAGLVVERGSILSHTAIIGRELGIPTVVAVANATSLIADGQLLEIDGAAGTVHLIG
jgi:pyruvate,water dikinase